MQTPAALAPGTQWVSHPGVGVGGERDPSQPLPTELVKRQILTEVLRAPLKEAGLNQAA